MFVSLQGFPGPRGLEGASGRKGEHVSESEKITLTHMLILLLHKSVALYNRIYMKFYFITDFFFTMALWFGWFFFTLSFLYLAT